MTDVSVIIPARNERFLTKTINDVVAKSCIDTEVIIVLEGYWPKEEGGGIVDHPAVRYIHFSKPRGMRNALNAGVAIAKGKYVMKLDGHCMMGEGFDKVLAETCQDNWVCIPTRHRLDPEDWVINNGNRPPINYQYINLGNDNLDGKEWRAKNRDRSFDAIRVDDIISAQGSMYFLPRDLWYELELLDVTNYGTFRKDPQEVMYKCWTSGGRCVRVKDTWYAHLYKGRRYGRGYSSSRADWKKGDEYVKQWWTDSAWAKQQIPFREIIAGFTGMPGWEEHPWMTEQVEPTVLAEPTALVEPTELVKPTVLIEPKREPVPEKKRENLYQVLTLPGGEPFSRPKPDRAASRFWNEGKWKTFIEPLLSKDVSGQTFVEMGCNAGLFLKMAKDHGFEHVVGIEKNRTPVREGKRFRDAIGYDYSILKRALGSKFHEPGSFDIDELPMADVTLLSTFHYYIDINAWIRYLDRLMTKSCHVLIVSRPDLKDNHWLAKAARPALYAYFEDWLLMGNVDSVPKEGDSKPRDLYSLMYENQQIKRVPISTIDSRKRAGYPMHEAKDDLAAQIANGEDFDLFATDYYRAWCNRKDNKWPERTTRRFVQLKADVMANVRDNGLKDPILVDTGLRLCDGGHRLSVLKAMGATSVIVRVIA